MAVLTLIHTPPSLLLCFIKPISEAGNKLPDGPSVFSIKVENQGLNVDKKGELSSNTVDKKTNLGRRKNYKASGHT